MAKNKQSNRGNQQDKDEEQKHYSRHARKIEQQPVLGEQQEMPGERKSKKDNPNKAKPQNGSLK